MYGFTQPFSGPEPGVVSTVTAGILPPPQFGLPPRLLLPKPLISTTNEYPSNQSSTSSDTSSPPPNTPPSSPPALSLEDLVAKLTSQLQISEAALAAKTAECENLHTEKQRLQEALTAEEGRSTNLSQQLQAKDDAITTLRDQITSETRCADNIEIDLNIAEQKIEAYKALLLLRSTLGQFPSTITISTSMKANIMHVAQKPSLNERGLSRTQHEEKCEEVFVEAWREGPGSYGDISFVYHRYAPGAALRLQLGERKDVFCKTVSEFKSNTRSYRVGLLAKDFRRNF
ncbi:hypothetical protein HDV00_000867 [Rhizophlyctis rosea]|nr:hypothetical protein HDV00_000867 [Rhizophlyctis rosea]